MDDHLILWGGWHILWGKNVYFKMLLVRKFYFQPHRGKVIYFHFTLWSIWTNVRVFIYFLRSVDHKTASPPPQIQCLSPYKHNKQSSVAIALMTFWWDRRYTYKLQIKNPNYIVLFWFFPIEFTFFFKNNRPLAING